LAGLDEKKLVHLTWNGIHFLSTFCVTAGGHLRGWFPNTEYDVGAATRINNTNASYDLQYGRDDNTVVQPKIKQLACTFIGCCLRIDSIENDNSTSLRN